LCNLSAPLAGSLLLFGKAIVLFGVGLGSTGCIAPLSDHPSGRSVGEGNVIASASISAIQDADGGYLPLPEMRWLRGMGKDLDVGVESVIPISGGLVARYSLINPEGDGLALAVHGRFGLSPWTLGSSYYAGAGSTLSFRQANWEPFLVARFNVSRMDIDPSTDKLFLYPDSSNEFDENYTSISAGLAWWTSEQNSVFAALSFINGIEGEFDELNDFVLLTVGFSSRVSGIGRVP
jgi:hypothetical protein